MIVTPIIGGTLTGVINATIEGGVAYPQVVGNGTVSVPQIILYGTTADNSSFLIQEAGVGGVAHQNTRIVSLFLFLFLSLFTPVRQEVML